MEVVCYICKDYERLSTWAQNTSRNYANATNTTSIGGGVLMKALLALFGCYSVQRVLRTMWTYKKGRNVSLMLVLWLFSGTGSLIGWLKLQSGSTIPRFESMANKPCVYRGCVIFLSAIEGKRSTPIIFLKPGRLEIVLLDFRHPWECMAINFKLRPGNGYLEPKPTRLWPIRHVVYCCT